MAGPLGINAVSKGKLFSTPKPQRQDPNLFAPDPTLRQPSSDFLNAFLKNPQSITNLLPPTSSLQQQTGDLWGSFLKNLLGKPPGQGVLDAATPIFERNLQLGADTLRQSGPRFASNTERLIANQGREATQDFNLFTQQVMQEGLNQQMAGLTGAGGFANQQQGMNLNFLLPLMQQMFGTAFGAGGLTQPGVVTQAQPWWQQLLNAGSQVGGIVTGMGGGKQGSATPTQLGTTSINPTTNWIQNGGSANPDWFNLPRPSYLR